MVSTAATDETVITAISDKCVIAITTCKSVVAVITDKRVVVSTACQIFNVDQTVAACFAAERIAKKQVDRNRLC